MRAESFGAAAASVGLGAVVVLASLYAGELLLEVPDHGSARVVATGSAFDTVDVAHLLETESRSTDAHLEPRPSTPGAPQATTDAPGSATTEARSPALAEVGTRTDEDSAVEPGPPRPAPQPSPRAAPPRQPGDSERRLAEPAAPAPSIRALSESSGSRLVADPDRDRSASEAPVPAATREPVEQGAETADERVRSASLETSRQRPGTGEPAIGNQDADLPEATARELGEADPGKPDKARTEAETEKTEAEEAPRGTSRAPDPAPGKPEPGTSGSGQPVEPATPATPAEPKPGAGDPGRPPQDPPPVEPATPATPATPAQHAADPAVGRGPADEATDADG